MQNLSIFKLVMISVSASVAMSGGTFSQIVYANGAQQRVNDQRIRILPKEAFRGGWASSMDATFSGTMIARNGCAMLATSTRSFTLIWPRRARITNGGYGVTFGEGGGTAAVNARLMISGGLLSNVSLAKNKALRAMKVPRQCRGDTILVGEIMS